MRYEISQQSVDQMVDANAPWKKERVSRFWRPLSGEEKVSIQNSFRMPEKTAISESGLTER